MIKTSSTGCNKYDWLRTFSTGDFCRGEEFKLDQSGLADIV
jgi:hypothetical protein